jgi:2-dehydro-3-deoxy-D-arabinonate dehydratase
MRLTQIRDPFGLHTAAIYEKGHYHPIPNHTVVSLIRQAEEDGRPLADLARALAMEDAFTGSGDIPITPPEVWACGCTYAPSADFRDAELGTREGMYSYVYKAPRPEIFFKGTARVCVGPGDPIGIRSDSKFTAPEPELAIVIDGSGKIVGYMLGNDVSAWDIERENALYLPQSKVYRGCCSLGPVLVTPDEVPDPYDLYVTCTITRGDEKVFAGGVSTAKLNRRFDTLIEYLRRSNPVPAGTVIMTGTGIIVPETAALQPGDVVAIEVPEIGRLSNPAEIVN